MGGSHTTESLQQLSAMPHVRVCLHLNILEGRCTAPLSQVRPLVDAQGIFQYGLGQMLYTTLSLFQERQASTVILAMRHGEMGVIAPFRYAVILFAIALGYLVWGDIPDIFTITGTVIVVATGLYTIHRERLRAAELRAGR